MNGVIDGKNFVEMAPMKYWSVPAAQLGRQKEIIQTAVFSGDYIGALKVDGYYQRVVKDEDGNCFMIARSRNVKGEVVNKIEWVPHLNKWFEKLPNGTCLLCECYLPGNEGSKNITTILGCLKDKAIARQKNAPLHLYVFDCAAFAGKSFMDKPYEYRAKFVAEAVSMLTSEYVEYASYYEGEELWEKLQEYLEEGREGMVIMRKDAKIYEKRTPARISIKVKKEISQTIDCFFTGRGTQPTKEYNGKEIETWKYWVNPITDERLPEGERYFEYVNGGSCIPVTKPYYYNWCGSVEIGLVKDNKIVPIGLIAGVTDEIKANISKFKGAVIEVSAMEIDNESHALRHGKMLQFRTDKNWKECTYDQLFQ